MLVDGLFFAHQLHLQKMDPVSHHFHALLHVLQLVSAFRGVAAQSGAPRGFGAQRGCRIAH